MLTSRVVRKVHVKVPTRLPGPQRVKVGFPSGEADQDIINRAIWNNFGTKGGASGGGWGGPIPERPFMQNAMRANQIRYVTAMRSSAAKIVRGETTLTQTIQKLGIFAQGHIQEEITSLSSPPNSPVTIALKGSSSPLIDTGEMRGAVTFKADNT
jgi:hypothetical protein